MNNLNEKLQRGYNQLLLTGISFCTNWIVSDSPYRTKQQYKNHLIDTGSFDFFEIIFLIFAALEKNAFCSDFRTSDGTFVLDVVFLTTPS